MQNDSDHTRQLLDQVQANEPEAFDRLFELHRSYLKGVIQVHLLPNSRFDASDVVQETHLYAHKNFERFLQRRPMPFKLWLRKTAQQRLASMLRLHSAEKRNVSRQQPLFDNSTMIIAKRLTGEFNSPSELVHRLQTIRQIATAIGQLSDSDRETLVLRHFEGLSHREIAEIQDIDEAAARKRYGRVLLRFQRLLVQNGVNESDSL